MSDSSTDINRSDQSLSEWTLAAAIELLESVQDHSVELNRLTEEAEHTTLAVSLFGVFINYP